MNAKIKGGIYGCIAAISYGLNPLCAGVLYGEGVNTLSALFYRFAFGALILGAMMAAQRRAFGVTRREAGVLAVLGVLFAVSSLTYFLSFHHMSGGVAATLVFAYPVMTAVIMAVFFGERLSSSGILSVALTVAGIALLYQGDGGGSGMSLVGFGLVMLSALTYAVYIVVINRAHFVMSSVKLTFYAMLVCLICIVAFALVEGEPLMLLATARTWTFAFLLGLVPTVISLVYMAMAIKLIGSTPTAVMGALEPVTAVVLGAIVFGDVVTPRLTAGIALILVAVMLVILGGRLPRLGSALRIVRAGRIVLKRWRWK